jgi:hypothetical protein
MDCSKGEELMPCRDGRDDEDREITRRRLDEATRAACDMAKMIHRLSIIYCGKDRVIDFTNLLDKDTQHWIKEHNLLYFSFRRCTISHIEEIEFWDKPVSFK